jgi:hypothetical protein
VISIFSKKPIPLPRIRDPIRTDLAHFVQQGDDESLRHFSQLCHELITDRDVSFTLRDRTALYRKWLATGHPALMAVVHDQVPLGASIILPLTESAYQSFWYGELDAPEIDKLHLVRKKKNKGYRYLLVDVVAIDKSFFQNVPAAVREELIGIGLRSMIYHSSMFFNPKAAPIVLCSTANKKLQSVLLELGFEKSSSKAVSAYRTDLARQRGWYPPNVQQQYDRWKELVSAYQAEAGQPAAKATSEL